MKVDIKFIAKKAGVSPATVSRVVNRTKKVSPELKKRVMAEIEKYDYHANAMARGLILKKSNLIGVMSPSVSNYFHATIISAIEKQANLLGYNVIIVNVSVDFERQKKGFSSICERQVDGIILLHENTAEEINTLISGNSIPMVLASINVPNCQLPAVGIDDMEASYCAVKHLISLGHRKISGIFGNCFSLEVLRKNGFDKALAEANITECHCVWTGTTIEAGSKATEEIFSQPNPPTALFCVSDEIAIGAIDKLIDLGYKVPEDISVIGFDDIQLSEFSRPRLTTIHQPINTIGKKSCEMLMKLIKKEEIENSKIILPYQLVIRESCFANKEEYNVRKQKQPMDEST